MFEWLFFENDYKYKFWFFCGMVICSIWKGYLNVYLRCILVIFLFRIIEEKFEVLYENNV